MVVQDCPVLKLAPQLLVWEKLWSPFSRLISAISRGSTPTLVRVVLTWAVQTQAPLLPLATNTHPSPNEGGSSLAAGPEEKQANCADPRTVPPLPAADAIMPMGPPRLIHVAIPVAASTRAILESDDVHCRGKLLCVVGAWLKVPVALKGMVPSGGIAWAFPGCTLMEIS